MSETRPETPLDESAAETVRDGAGQVLRTDAPASARTTRDDTVGPPADERSAPAIGRTRPGEAYVKRYSVDEFLGAGTTGRVFAVHDSLLERDVAAKVAGRKAGQRSRESFMREAAMSAALQHPNIIPIYDMDCTDSGEMYFTMGHIQGASLGDLIKRATTGGQTAPELRSPDEIVRIFLKVCDAVSYAHSRGVVHQDIKPANIMLGNHGEAILVDWGTARRSEEAPSSTGSPTGSPAYMAPEQARCEPSDTRSDIYAIGASMFHALFLRHAVDTSEAEGFWVAKKAGRLSLPTEEERARVPAPVVSIVLRAMAARPEDRYQTIDELSQDLKNYQAGLAVAAHRDSFAAWLTRWYRRNTQAFWGAAAVVTLLAAFGWVLYIWKLKEVATWGLPAYSTSFADSSWHAHWVKQLGAFRRDSMGIVSESDANRIVYRERLYGDVAIEFSGTILHGARPGDLSVVWYDDITVDSATDSIHEVGEVYALQTGAFDNTSTAIRRDGPDDGLFLAFNELTLRTGRWYRIRAEIEHATMRLLVDGRQVVSYTAPVPFGSGYVGLYGHYPGKRFTNVQIFVKDVPQLVPALAIGDSYYRHGEYQRASEEYLQVALAHRGSALAREGRYRQALALRAAGDSAAAYEVWSTLLGTEFRGRAYHHLMERMMHQHRYDDYLDTLGLVYGLLDEQSRALAAGLWSTAVAQLMQAENTPRVRGAVALQERLFSERSECYVRAAKALRWLGRAEEVLVKYPGQRVECCRALADLMRYDEVAEACGDVPWLAVSALTEANRLDEAFERFGATHTHATHTLFALGEHRRVAEMLPNVPLHAAALNALGMHEEVLKQHPDDRDQAAEALRSLGRGDEVLRDYRDVPGQVARTLIGRGRFAEALSVPNLPFGERDLALMYLDSRNMLDSIYRDRLMPRTVQWYMSIAGYLDSPNGRIRQIADSLRTQAWQSSYQDDLTELLLALLEELEGNRGAILRECRAVAENTARHPRKRVGLTARLILGGVTLDEYMAQDYQWYTHAQSLLAQALRAEATGDTGASRTYYTSYLGLPDRERSPDWVVANLIVTWRLSALGGT